MTAIIGKTQPNSMEVEEEMIKVDEREKTRRVYFIGHKSMRWTAWELRHSRDTVEGSPKGPIRADRLTPEWMGIFGQHRPEEVWINPQEKSHETAELLDAATSLKESCAPTSMQRMPTHPHLQEILLPKLDRELSHNC